VAANRWNVVVWEGGVAAGRTCVNGTPSLGKKNGLAQTANAAPAWARSGGIIIV